ncbi:hypothetical protein HKD37_08G021337 [Glycine soja]
MLEVEGEFLLDVEGDGVVPLGCEATLFIRLFSFSFPKLLGGLRMYFAVTIKRYQAVKEVGQIKMSVGVIGYNQLMLVCQVNFSFSPLLGCHGGGFGPSIFVSCLNLLRSLALRDTGLGGGLPYIVLHHYKVAER